MAGDHAGQHVASTDDRTEQVDFHAAPPLNDIALGEGLQGFRSTGIVYQHVDGAERLFARADRVLGDLSIRNIGGIGRGTSAYLLHESNGL